jgi:hypothetical protein
MNYINIICPVKDQDWGRFDILNHTLNKHLKIDYKLITISPSGNCPIKNKKIISYADLDIIPQLNKPIFQKTGWWKQQAIKLAANTKVDSDIALILDADCFMVKDMHYKDIIEDKRIKVKIAKGGSWDNWYHGSSKILNLNIDYKAGRIGVTPLVLSIPIIKSLESYLTTLYGSPWEYLLSNTTVYDEKFNPPTSPTWTEYCLYHIYGVQSGLWNKYHLNTNIDLSGNCFWNTQQADEWDPEKSFINPHFYFSVAQSISGKSSEWVKDKISKYIY